MPAANKSLTLQQDPVKVNQILYNGREWHNLYTYIKGDQFLFSKDYMQASLTISGKTYNNIDINYDIYNDEIITPSYRGIVLQLNKEMVDSFSVFNLGKRYRFVNMREDSPTGIKGYVNSLYSGKSSLVVKYKKEIDLLAVDEKYDLFFQTYRIYLLKDGKARQLTGKKDILNVFEDEKTLIKAFLKKNPVKISKKDPDSFIPVIRYYDTLSQ
jgi:hypothetical protein